MEELNNTVIHHLQIFGQLSNNEHYKIIIQDIILEYRKVPISTTYLDINSMIYDYLSLDGSNCLNYLVSSNLLTQLINLFYSLHYLNHSINYESSISMIFLFELLLDICNNNYNSENNDANNNNASNNKSTTTLSIKDLCMKYKLGHTLFLILYLKDLKYSFKYKQLLFKLLRLLTLYDFLNSSIFNNYIVTPFLKIANLKDILNENNVTITNSTNNNDPKNELIQIELSINLINELNLNYQTIEKFNLFEAILIYFKFYHDNNKLENYNNNIESFQSINFQLLKLLTNKLLPDLIDNEYFFDLIYFLLKCLNNDISRIRKDHRGSVNRTIQSLVNNSDKTKNINNIFFDVSFKVEIIKFFRALKSKHLIDFNFLQFSNVFEAVIFLLNQSVELYDDIQIMEFLVDDLLNNYNEEIRFTLSSKQLVKLSDKIDNLFFNVNQRFTFIEEPCEIIQSQRSRLTELYLNLLKNVNFINLINHNTSEQHFPFSTFFKHCQFFESFNSLYLLKRKLCLSVFFKNFQYYENSENPSMIKSLIIEYNKTLFNNDESNSELQLFLIERIYEILVQATKPKKITNQQKSEYEEESFTIIELDNNLNNLKFLELALSSSNNDSNSSKFRNIAIYLIFENVSVFIHLIIKNFDKIIPNFDDDTELSKISLLIIIKFLEYIRKNPQPLEYLFLKNESFISFFENFNNLDNAKKAINTENYVEILSMINVFTILENNMILLQKDQQGQYHRIINLKSLSDIFIEVVNCFVSNKNNIQGSDSANSTGISTTSNPEINNAVEYIDKNTNISNTKISKSENIENNIPFFIELLNFLNNYKLTLASLNLNSNDNDNDENDTYYFRMLEMFSYGILFNKNLKTFQKFIIKLNKKVNCSYNNSQKPKILKFFQSLTNFIIMNINYYHYRNSNSRLNQFLTTMEVYLIFGHIVVNLNNLIIKDKDNGDDTDMFIWDFLDIFNQLNEKNIEFNKQIILFGKTNIILSLLSFASLLINNDNNNKYCRDFQISNKFNLIFKNFKLFINDFKNFKSLLKKEIIEKLIMIFYNGVKNDELQFVKLQNEHNINNKNMELVDYYSKELMINCLFPCMITYFYKPTSHNNNNTAATPISNQLKSINDILSTCLKVLTMHPTDCTILEFVWKCIYFYSFIDDLKISTINFIINDIILEIYDGRLSDLYNFDTTAVANNNRDANGNNLELKYYIIASIYQLCLNDDDNNNSNGFINFEGYSYSNNHNTTKNNNIYRIRKRKTTLDNEIESYDDINLTLFSYVANKLNMNVDVITHLLTTECNQNNNVDDNKKAGLEDDETEGQVMRNIIIDDLNAFKEIVVNCNLFNDSLNLRRSLAVRKH